MAYEYYEKLLSHTKECYSKGLITNKKLLKQLEEVYRKAKAFDKISNLIEENYVDYGENNLEDVEAIVNEYWEDE
jgi:predicted transcriptional regulator